MVAKTVIIQDRVFQIESLIRVQQHHGDSLREITSDKIKDDNDDDLVVAPDFAKKKPQRDALEDEMF